MKVEEAKERAIHSQYGFIVKINKFRCFICQETFVDEDSIYNHVKNIHKETIRKNSLIIKAWGG